MITLERGGWGRRVLLSCAPVMTQLWLEAWFVMSVPAENKLKAMEKTT
jgi:hypothetical protein